jgi:hypothetical protein
VQASIIDVGAVDHLDSNRLGTAATVRWFLQQSQQGHRSRSPTRVDAHRRGA